MCAKAHIPSITDFFYVGFISASYFINVVIRPKNTETSAEKCDLFDEHCVEENKVNR